MNTLGQIIRVIQTVVLVVCSIRLAVGSAPLRRSSRMADIVRWSLTAGIIILGAANSFWAKYSSMECTITQWGLFLVLIIFYKMRFWQLLIQLLLYWSGVKLFCLAIVFYASYFSNISVKDYLDDMTVPWSVLHLAAMLVLIFFLIGFTYLKKGHLLFECRTVKDYLLVGAIVLGERILEDYVFSPDMAFTVLEGEYIVFCGVLLLAFVCGSNCFDSGKGILFALEQGADVGNANAVFAGAIQTAAGGRTGAKKAKPRYASASYYVIGIFE